CSQDETTGTPKKKETKRKFKLKPHEDQIFLDGNEVRFMEPLYTYWGKPIVLLKLFSISFYSVIAVIAATLFLLRPAGRHVGVYYLSAGWFVTSIILLATGKCRAPSLYPFPIIWLLTGGRDHFWFLPNLTADVGFIDSFRAPYTRKYKERKTDSKKEEKSESKKQQKCISEEKPDSKKKEEDNVKTEATRNSGTPVSGGKRHSDTDSDRCEEDKSGHSSGNGNGFEMVTKEELDQQPEEEECEEEDTESRPSCEKS
ncbi:SEC62 protein, partial [Columbina picui]|nr:SEC62 protein [Columbina picui]